MEIVKGEEIVKIGILGVGASGIIAAIAAAEAGGDVTILEKNDRIGKKLLATGNGKCNFSNLELSSACYHSDTPECIDPVLRQFTISDTLAFFHRIGLMTKEKNGGLYPACEQAAAVLDVLRFWLEHKKVQIKTNCQVIGITYARNMFCVNAKVQDEECSYRFDRIILSCGSKAGIKKDADENGQKLAGLFNLKQTPFVPALVQMRCQETYFKALAGVRCQAEVTLLAKGMKHCERGELQLTDYGISGIPVFQLSRHGAKMLQNHNIDTLPVFLDFLPEFSDQQWKKMLLERRQNLGFETMERFFTGTVHKKIAGVILKLSGIPSSVKAGDLETDQLLSAGKLLKELRVTVTGVNPFWQAQVCAGGVRLSELTTSLEAKRQKGLYVTGELLDVDGRCGGYNLQWAWTTGMVAGRAAARGSN